MRVDVRRSVRHTYADTHACPLAHFPTLYQIWKKERREVKSDNETAKSFKSNLPLHNFTSSQHKDGVLLDCLTMFSFFVAKVLVLKQWRLTSLYRH